ALEVWGIGFKSADAIAQRLGIDKKSPARAEAGLLHVLGELTGDGHVHVPEHHLAAAAEKALEVGPDVLGPALARLVEADRIVREELSDRGDCLAPKALSRAEIEAASGLARLLARPALPLDLDVE